MPAAAPELSLAYRTVQARRAAVIAALVARYYQTRVDVEDPSSVKRWLDILLPRILGGRRDSAVLAAAYGNKIRDIEIPGDKAFSFTPVADIEEAVVRASLSIVGPGSLTSQMAKINKLDVPETSKQALIKQATASTATAVKGATFRHVANGGRQTILEGAKADKLALGYVRVTRDHPCFFCALLASRGLVYDEHSFDDSDPRFTGDGTVKVHDSCQCGLKPAYNRADPLLDRSKEWNAMWYRTGSLLAFRQEYEGRAKD